MSTCKKEKKNQKKTLIKKSEILYLTIVNELRNINFISVNTVVETQNRKHK